SCIALLEHTWRAHGCRRAFDDPNDCAPFEKVVILTDDLNGTLIDFLWPAVRGSEHAHHSPNFGSRFHIVCAVSSLTLGKAANEDADLQPRLLRRHRRKDEGARH